ncbi:MAG TPA: MlaD family protein [Nocardioides sp.]|nr:MlaD family protein [Nocardioides sp.]
MLKRIPARALVAGVVLALVAAFFAVRALSSDDYELVLLMPAADGLVDGTPVKIDGRESGQVTDVSVKGNAAQVTIVLDDSAAPLHAGTQARIAWNSVIGRREIDITPGDEANAALPTGKVIQSKTERVELDDLVAALDAPTRRKVKSLVSDLQSVVEGNHQNLRKTLLSAGPFVGALGEVLQGVGADGDTIKRLVSDVRRVTSALSRRDGELSTSVSNVTDVLDAAVQQEQQLRDALDEVNGTVDAGNRLFGKLPGAVDATVPLLEDLRPATDRLPAVARRLDPVLSDLRPVVHQLRPTLAAAQGLLGQTPALLDNGTPVVGGVDQAVTSLQPAIEFLRPYTPEVVGFLTNWASLFSAKNSSGHFGRAMIPASATSFNSNPGVMPPGITQWEAPLPGQLADQPWTDANGDTVR